MLRHPVLILSDLHLGHPASRVTRVEDLRPLIEGAGSVVFNGDTFQELAREFRERSREKLDELRDLCARLGVEAHFLSGNHDPGWPGPGWLELAGGRIVVTHGDAVFWQGSPWSRERYAREDQLEELWREHLIRKDDAGERLRLAREVARTLRADSIPCGRSLPCRIHDALDPPRRGLEILRVWLTQADAIAGFAERYFPSAEVMVVGHFHRAGVWRRGGRLVVNSGAFLRPHAARWVEWSGDYLRVGRIEMNGCYRRGGVNGVWHLPGPAEKPAPARPVAALRRPVGLTRPVAT